MCGIAGFVGVPDAQRLALAYTLGVAIDNRGGHGAGFVGSRGDTVEHMRKEGEFSGASWKFLRTAASCDALILHSRYGTCGGRSAKEAHPFAIKRDKRTILWGAHNGVLDNAKEFAKEHGRSYDVDSRELFELLADDLYDEIAQVQGYGTLAWIRSEAQDTIRLVRMTRSGDLEIAKLEDDAGYVFGSTRDIIKDGIEATDLRIEHFYTLETGDVVTLHAARGVEGTHEKIVLAERTTHKLWSDYGKGALWTFGDDPIEAGANDPTSTDYDGFADYYADEEEAVEFALDLLVDGMTTADLKEEGFTDKQIDAALEQFSRQKKPYRRHS